MIWTDIDITLFESNRIVLVKGTKCDGSILTTQWTLVFLRHIALSHPALGIGDHLTTWPILRWYSLGIEPCSGKWSTCGLFWILIRILYSCYCRRTPVNRMLCRQQYWGSNLNPSGSIKIIHYPDKFGSSGRVSPLLIIICVKEIGPWGRYTLSRLLCLMVISPWLHQNVWYDHPPIIVSGFHSHGWWAFLFEWSPP